MKSIEDIPLANICASLTNPRKEFDPVKLQELADDIKENGVRQAIMVRPLPGALPGTAIYQIVYGERRYRASGLAGKTEIPAEVREMGDQEALEAQMVENLLRADLDPMEESEGYQAMLDFRGEDGKAVYTVDLLASKVRKEASYIYRRLKLRQLPPSARQAVLDGVLPLATATLIARIPGDEQRKTAAAEIIKPKYQQEPLSRDKAQELIRQNYMRELKGAPFDQSDPTLYPKMGACTTCPLRTGNAKEVYGDVQRGDICTNPPCFSRKSDVTWARVQASAEKENKQVLDEEQSKKIFDYNGDLAWNTEYVDLKKQPERDDLAPGTTNPPSWKKLIAKAPAEVPTVLARNKFGRVHELALRTHATEAAKQAAAATGKPDIIVVERANSTANTQYKAQQKALRDQAKLDQEVARRVVGLIAANIEEEGVSFKNGFEGAMFATALYHAGSDGCYFVAKRNELTCQEGESYSSAVERFAEEHALMPCTMSALIVEILVARGVRASGYNSEVLKPWLKLCKIDIESVIATVRGEKKPKGKKKAQAKQQAAEQV